MAINTDTNIVMWKSTKSKYVPNLVEDMLSRTNGDRNTIYTIHGSRNVGKTTLVKLFLRELVKRITPWRVCYCTDASGINGQDLKRIILDYLEMSHLQRGDERCYIVIDDISLNDQWQYAILELYNRHKLENCTFIITGSNTTKLNHATKRFVGTMESLERRYRSLFPMSFLEYANLEKGDVHKFLETHGAYNHKIRSSLLNSLSEKQGNKILESFSEISDQLNSLLRKYTLTGGMPRVVNSMFKDEIINDQMYREHLGIIMHEWADLKHDVKLLQDCVTFILKSTGNTISWKGMAEKINVVNANIAKTYAGTLRDMHIALVTRTYDEKKDQADVVKVEKIHIRDPFFFHSLNAVDGDVNHFARACEYVTDEANMGKLVECIVADHLDRSALSDLHAEPVVEPLERIFHWRDGYSHEVDFVYRQPGSSPIPIEVKYAKHVNKSKLVGVKSFVEATAAKQGIVASQNEYTIEDAYTIVPAGVLLLLLS